MSREYFPAAALSKPSLLRWSVALFVDYSVVVLAMVAAHSAFGFARQRDFAAVPDLLAFAVIGFAILVIGTRQHGILVLGHDGSHGLVSRKVWWNDLLTNLFCFWPFGMGLSGYRKFHFAHHRHMGTESDPELIHKKSAAPRFDLPATPARIVGHAVVALFGAGIADQAFLIKYIVSRDSLAPVAMWAVFVLGFWVFDAWWVPVLWFTALGTSFWASTLMRVWTEHMGTEETHRIYARPIYRLLFLPHNIWYHFEHHRFPAVPFWNLRRARALDIETPVQSLEALLLSYRGYRFIPSGMPVSPALQLEQLEAA